MKTEIKDLGVETFSGGGVMKEEKFPHNRKPSHRHFSREFWNLRGQNNQKEKRKKEKRNRICT